MIDCWLATLRTLLNDWWRESTRLRKYMRRIDPLHHELLEFCVAKK